MQKIPGFVGRTILINGVCAVIGLVFFVLLWFAGEHGGGVTLWIGIGGFVGSVILTMAIQAWRARHFRCPQCGELIPVRYRDSGSQWGSGRYRVQFLCPKCDIIWDTGLRQ